ncbi:Sybindin-like family protein [Cooperia oncophora]
MSIQQVFIISRAGSLIYDWEAKTDVVEVERICEYPLDIILEEVDQKAMVVFGEKDGTRFFVDDTEHNILKYLEDESNFPVSIRFSPPSVSTNEKIILSSMFHSLFTIAVQLSPAARSSGIEESNLFVVTSPSAAIPIESLLNKLYELYADYALKNPFYAIDMPIRCSKFEEGLKLLLERVDKNSTSVTI